MDGPHDDKSAFLFRCAESAAASLVFQPLASHYRVLQESELTPTGANLLDGRYAVFGYLIDGAALLQNAQASHSSMHLCALLWGNL